MKEQRYDVGTIATILPNLFEDGLYHNWSTRQYIEHFKGATGIITHIDVCTNGPNLYTLDICPAAKLTCEMFKIEPYITTTRVCAKLDLLDKVNVILNNKSNRIELYDNRTHLFAEAEVGDTHVFRIYLGYKITSKVIEQVYNLLDQYARTPVKFRDIDNRFYLTKPRDGKQSFFADLRPDENDYSWCEALPPDCTWRIMFTSTDIPELCASFPEINFKELKRVYTSNS